MKRFFRLPVKSKHLFAILLILSAGLIVVSMTVRPADSMLHKASGVVVTPFQKGITSVANAVSDRFEAFFRSEALAEENRELKAQVGELKDKLTRSVEEQEELERLRALYELDNRYEEYTKIAALVIAKDTGNWYSSFTIDRGSDDGIAVDMNVIAQGGLIGIVTEVGPHYAKVRSIIDDQSNVSAMAATTSEPCLVAGDLLGMEDGKIRFYNLRDQDNLVTEGTTIVTSNISEKYLTGLLIGQVSEVSSDSNNLTKSGTIIPAADFRRLREVLVITELKKVK